MNRRFATIATLAVAGALPTSFTALAAEPAKATAAVGPRLLQQDEFDREVLQSKGHVLLYVSGSRWCGPCIAMNPVINDLAANTGGKYVMKNLDFSTSVEDRKWFYKHIGDVYGTDQVPSLLLFKDGKLTGKYVGYGGEDKSVVRDWLNKSLKGLPVPANTPSPTPTLRT